MSNIITLKKFHPIVWIIVFNFLVVLYYYMSVDVAIKFLPSFLLIIMGLCIISMIFNKIGFIQNTQVGLFGIILFFLFMELFRFSPGVLPLSIRNYLATDDPNPTKKVVEYLHESPFVKFKPDVVVRSQGYRGTEKQFVYQWKTDRWGFKNPDSVLDRKKDIQIVVLGDSFAEGMGVATKDTFSALLSRDGYLTYDLGVQGYSPKQLEGSFRLYGLKLKPKYVIIAYYSGSFQRELAYLDENAVLKTKKFIGGIGEIDSSENKEIREKTRQITTALFLMARNLYRSARENFEIIDDMWTSLIDRFSGNYLRSRYSFEISLAGAQKSDLPTVEQSLDWQSTVKSFINIKKMADQIGAQVILIILPSRGDMYYEKATGKPLLRKGTILGIETKLLKELCKKENMVFLDPSKRIESYVSKLNSKQIELYPYLEIDGHPSKYGHELIKEEIENYLTKAAKTRNELSGSGSTERGLIVMELAGDIKNPGRLLTSGTDSPA